MTLVVDASVALKWFVAEPGSQAAVSLLSAGEALVAPDLIVAELTNAAWRSWRRGELLAEQARAIPPRLGILIQRLHSCAALAPRATEIALELEHPAYDCFYLALAERHRTVVVTADRRLVTKLDGTPFAELARALTASVT